MKVISSTCVCLLWSVFSQQGLHRTLTARTLCTHLAPKPVYIFFSLAGHCWPHQFPSLWYHTCQGSIHVRVPYSKSAIFPRLLGRQDAAGEAVFIARIQDIKNKSFKNQTSSCMVQDPKNDVNMPELQYQIKKCLISHPKQRPPPIHSTQYRRFWTVSRWRPTVRTLRCLLVDLVLYIYGVDRHVSSPTWRSPCLAAKCTCVIKY